MKFIVVAFVLLLSINSLIAQITNTKSDGGSVVVKLSMGIKVNDGSTLKREYITLNDATCPIQLNNVGINAEYTSSRYEFKPVGDFVIKEPIVAYQVLHVIYNVFGEHMKTLSNSEMKDMETKSDFSKYSSWYATENNLSEYLTCVSYVANVRTKSGVVWHYNYKAIKEQLTKLQIAFEEGYLPKKDIEK